MATTALDTITAITQVDGEPSSSSSPFTDKLSAEIRIIIYGYLFGTNQHVKLVDTSPVSPKKEQKKNDASMERSMISTSMFAVNKQLHDEALEAFHNNNTIQVDLQQLRWLLRDSEAAEFIRDIEVTDFVDTTPSEIQDLLQTAQRLPRFRSITMLSDCLAKTGSIGDHVCVKSFVEDHGLGQLVCTDIGRYKLLGPFAFVQFAHSKILKMWPNVRSTSDDFDVFAEIEKMSQDWYIKGSSAINIEIWASHASLRTWVALWEKAVEYRAQDKPLSDLLHEDNPRTHYSLGNWVRCAVRPEAATWVLPADERGVVPIHQLGPDHDSKALEMVTEFLSVNIESYYRGSTGAGGVLLSTLEKPRWAELGEGSLGVGESQRQQEAYKEKYAIFNPVNKEEWSDLGGVRDMILSSKRSVIILGEDRIIAATKFELQPMAYLLMAAGMLQMHWETGNESNEASLANWLRLLLQRYFGLAHPEAISKIARASLSMLRRYFCTAARTIRHVKGGRMTEASIKSRAEKYRAKLQSKNQGTESAQQDEKEDTAHAMDGMICESFMEQYAAHLVMAVYVEDDA